MKKPLLFLTSLLLSPALSADLLVGRAVDEHGVGIPGIDIDVKNLGGGGDPDIFNDGTDANGDFAVTVPAGFYRIIFNPPPPPASTNLILEVDDVVILGTTNLGTVVLPAGAAVFGRVVNELGVPVAGVNLDVIDASGDNLDLIGDTSNAFGQFAVAAPLEAVEVRFDTSGVAGQTLASAAVQLALTEDVDLGDLTLLNGVHLTGRVVGPGGGGVQGADLDVEDAATGVDLYTPKDNTDSNGNFDVVIPVGVWNIDVCPLGGQVLVGHVIEEQVVTGNTSLGNIALVSGVFLTGTVVDGSGTPVAGVDLDLNQAGGGPSVGLCADNTNASGQYSVIVPTGTFDIRISPPYSLPLGGVQVSSQTITGNTVLNAVLPDCAFGTSYGVGLAGQGGFVPVLANEGGAPRVGNDDWGYRISAGVGGSFAAVLVGIGPASVPAWSGTLLVNPLPVHALLPLVLGGAPGAAGTGEAPLTFPVPITTGLVGITLYAQALVQDLAAPNWISLSQGLSTTLCL